MICDVNKVLLVVIELGARGPRGYSLPFYMGGWCQCLGSEILHKIIFGICELQLRKKSIFEV